MRDLDTALTYVAGRVGSKGIIVTEWSQAGAARPWLKQNLADSFVKQWRIRSPGTNEQFIQAACGHPMAKAEWDGFVATAPYDSTYMRLAYAAMKQHRVIVATYGAGIQYGDVAFDSKQLFANLTVQPVNCARCPPPNYPENYHFAAWFRAMAAAFGWRPAPKH